MPRRVIIIGSGPAGLTAALYAARGGLEPTVIGGYQLGGQLMLTTEVENFPGFPEGVQGPELMDLMKRQAERFGAAIVPEDATRVELDSRPFKVYTDGQAYEGEAVIIATGSSAKWLGLESEQRLRGRGVSACATCDGFFFKGQDVVVVGGGDTALEEALFLTNFVKNVTVIHRRERLRASRILQTRAMKNPKISWVWNSTVEEVLGQERVEGVKIKNLVTGEAALISCRGVFIAIGHAPSTDIFRGKVELDEKGYVKARGETATNIEGVFVAGDVYDYVYRQAVTASASGCKAALDAIKYIESLEEKPAN